MGDRLTSWATRQTLAFVGSGGMTNQSSLGPGRYWLSCINSVIRYVECAFGDFGTKSRLEGGGKCNGYRYINQFYSFAEERRINDDTCMGKRFVLSGN